MTASHTGQHYRLSSPPVRRAVLEIQFTANPPVEGHHLWPFLARARDRFAKVSETPPTPSDTTPGYELLPGSGPWPVPRTHFDNGDIDLYIQGDELALGWDFGDDDNPETYVGFDVLKEQLSETFAELCGILEEAQIEVIPYHVSCFYLNMIDELSGRELVAGIATNWKMPLDVATGDEDYFGLRIQKKGSGRSERFESIIMVDSDSSGTPRLSFNVGTTINDGETPFDALDGAHDELIAEFRAHTSIELRKGWGE